MFEIFSFFFFIAFFGIFGLIVASFVREGKRHHQNNQSPRLTVEAKVVAKRTNVSHHGGEHHHSATRYFVTFEVASGDRMELPMTGPEYGLLVEGDWGELSFQGTRYLGFARKVRSYDNP